MNKSIFTVIFMIIITAVFIAVLAVVNAVALPQIEKNQKIQTLKSIMYAFQILPEGIREPEIAPTATTADLPWNESRIRRIRNNQFRRVAVYVPDSLKSLLDDSYLSLKDSAEIWIRGDDSGNRIAYGFNLKGMGLWGTITAFAVVSADLNSLVGIDFIEQVETPGLGARITEKEFKIYFRNLNLGRFETDSSEQPSIVMVRNKTMTNQEKSTHELQAITGATQTCDGVLKMLNTDLKFYLELLKVYRSSTAIRPAAG